MRRCVVINNNGRINYYVRVVDVKTIIGRDNHENVPIKIYHIKVTGALTFC